jgi:nucleotidyltransferase/DNA polymerase involved in DNA repair
MAGRVILHVDMDSFFASVEQQANPKLRGVPIAVSGDPKSRTVVAAASKEAKKFGVKSAMTIREARALCPQIQFVLGDPDKYVEVSRRVITILQSFTPDVEVASIDEAFLDVTGWVAQYACDERRRSLWSGAPGCGDARIPHRGILAGVPPSLSASGGTMAAQSSQPPAPGASLPATGAICIAQEIKRRIREEIGEWVTCSIGIASNKRLAKLASEFDKPDGLVFVYTDDPPSMAASAAEVGGASAHERSRGPSEAAHRSVPLVALPRLPSGEPCPLLAPHVVREAPHSPLPTFVSRSELLSSITLRDLCGIGARIETRLNGLGITTVGGLAAASLDLLVEEFGSYGYELHDMAMGHDESPVDAEDAEPKSMGHAATLPKDLKTLEEVRPVVEELSEKVAARLRRHGYRGSTIHVVLRFRDFTSRGEQTTIPDATDDGLRISREVMEILQGFCAAGSPDAAIGAGSTSARSSTPDFSRPFGPPQSPVFSRAPVFSRPLPKPVRLVGVSVGKFIRSTPLQTPLFPKDQRWRSATAALDAANDRYGDWTVQRASLLASERVLRKVAAAFRATSHLKGR